MGIDISGLETPARPHHQATGRPARHSEQRAGEETPQGETDATACCNGCWKIETSGRQGAVSVTGFVPP